MQRAEECFIVEKQVEDITQVEGEVSLAN